MRRPRLASRGARCMAMGITDLNFCFLIVADFAPQVSLVTEQVWDAGGKTLEKRGGEAIRFLIKQQKG